MATPWVEGYLHDGGWDVFGLIMAGKVLDSSVCAPLTMAAIAKIPGVFIAGFSILRAGASIKPHVGYTKDVWRSHLPLIADGQAYLSVGDERHYWAEKQIMVFDDTARHSACNPGERDRAILMVDFFKA